MFFLRRSDFVPVVAAAALLLAAACTGSNPPAEPVIRLVENPENGKPAFVAVEGVDRRSMAAARRLTPASDEWKRIFDVRIVNADGGPSPTPVAGTYSVAGSVLQFTPLFPFDPGRRYEARYNPSGLESGGDAKTIRAIVMRPAGPTPAATYVTHVFPSASVVPENQLRMYIHFSAPMGRRGGLDHVKLLDEKGDEVVDPFLPLDAEFWNADRTRYTLFFDPGRQKRGILPNRQMGPSLVAGRSYTLVVDREWIDGQRQPAAGDLHSEVPCGRTGSPAARLPDVAGTGTRAGHAQSALGGISRAARSRSVDAGNRRTT